MTLDAPADPADLGAPADPADLGASADSADLGDSADSEDPEDSFDFDNPLNTSVVFKSILLYTCCFSKDPCPQTCMAWSVSQGVLVYMAWSFKGSLYTWHGLSRDPYIHGTVFQSISHVLTYVPSMHLSMNSPILAILTISSDSADSADFDDFR